MLQNYNKENVRSLRITRVSITRPVLSRFASREVLGKERGDAKGCEGNRRRWKSRRRERKKRRMKKRVIARLALS